MRSAGVECPQETAEGRSPPLDFFEWPLRPNRCNHRLCNPVGPTPCGFSTFPRWSSSSLPAYKRAYKQYLDWMPPRRYSASMPISYFASWASVPFGGRRVSVHGFCARLAWPTKPQLVAHLRGGIPPGGSPHRLGHCRRDCRGKEVHAIVSSHRLVTNRRRGCSIVTRC